MVEERVEDLSNRFDVALNANDVAGLEQVLMEFDTFSKEVAERDVDVTTKQKELELCIALHDKMEEALEGIKLEIQKQLAKAKRNGKKINKYLNV